MENGGDARRERAKDRRVEVSNRELTVEKMDLG